MQVEFFMILQPQVFLLQKKSMVCFKFHHAQMCFVCGPYATLGRNADTGAGECQAIFTRRMGGRNKRNAANHTSLLSRHRLVNL
jgi:hypothetical protein